MRNPLNKRLPRELKSEIGKYIVLFIFLAGMISIVSGFIVAASSMSKAYDESFDKYNIEDGNFELYAEGSDDLLKTIEDDEDVSIYPNYYLEYDTKEVDSTLRIFKNRKEVDKICLMDGEFPATDSEIAIDRMYADNNDLQIGDTLTLKDKSFTISGLVALSDYSALFSSASDMMFDAVKFGVAIVTDDAFDAFGTAHLHYSYSWIYDNPPKDDNAAKEQSDDFLEALSADATASMNAVTNYIPQYTNQAIQFTGDDIKGDNAGITVFLYIVVLIIAFVFAITTSNTISKEANVIGTLRASGYTKGELIRHYLTMPLLVMLVAALIGNILGYTALKDFAASMYYGSYSLPTYVTIWSADAFVKTTVIPLILMFLMNLFVLMNKLSLSPLKFIRRDLKRHQKKKAFRLNSKIGILKRFRIRVIFQNLPNYITIVIGILFANFILMFGFMFEPMLDHFQEQITSNMIADYQYLLKAPQETENEEAEKYSATALKTLEENGKKSEEVSVYGIQSDSAYLDLDWKTKDDGVIISTAYANKLNIEEGDTITVKESYGDKEYTFHVDGVYDYPAAIAMFMPQELFNKTFDFDADSFNGYFSNTEITDIDDLYIATVITVDDMTKTSRQLKVSMGNMMAIFYVFGIIMFMLIVYLLSKIIIEKNAQSISMTKILGYRNSEINGLYVLPTSIVVIASMILTIPICHYIMKYVCIQVFADYPGWLEYYVPFYVFVKMVILGICGYAVIAFLQNRKVKKVPLGEALKNAE